MSKSQLQEIIESAFKNVTLDGGSSLLQCQAMDERCENITAEEYQQLSLQEIIDNWRIVPTHFLESYSQYMAHADASEDVIRQYVQKQGQPNTYQKLHQQMTLFPHPD